MESRETSAILRPVTPDLWPDLERLFGPRGACAGCWCMWWRLPRAEFERGKGEANRAALQALVADGDPPGLIAYVDGEPAGWVALGPRESFPALDRSRILAPVDDRPVWSIVCFFVGRGYRRRGLLADLIRGAVGYAIGRGAEVVEAYPVEPRAGARTADVFVYTGLASAFVKAGFVEVARRSPTRPIVRYPP